MWYENGLNEPKLSLSMPAKGGPNVISRFCPSTISPNAKPNLDGGTSRATAGQITPLESTLPVKDTPCSQSFEGESLVLDVCPEPVLANDRISPESDAQKRRSFRTEAKRKCLHLWCDRGEERPHRQKPAAWPPRGQFMLGWFLDSNRAVFEECTVVRSRHSMTWPQRSTVASLPCAGRGKGLSFFSRFLTKTDELPRQGRDGHERVYLGEKDNTCVPHLAVN